LTLRSVTRKLSVSLCVFVRRFMRYVTVFSRTFIRLGMDSLEALRLLSELESVSGGFNI
jgi:hypothetical protein